MYITYYDDDDDEETPALINDRCILPTIDFEVKRNKLDPSQDMQVCLI